MTSLCHLCKMDAALDLGEFDTVREPTQNEQLTIKGREGIGDLRNIRISVMKCNKVYKNTFPDTSHRHSHYRKKIPRIFELRNKNNNYQ